MTLLDYDLDTIIARVTEKYSSRIKRALSKLSDRRQKFVLEWAVDQDAVRASKTVSFCTKYRCRVIRNRGVWEAMEVIRQEQLEKSELSAEYTREYVRSVLDFQPTEYFRPALGGGWLIDEEGYSSLPTNVKRLIEEIEYRVVQGVVFLAVRFVSKTSALAMAVRLTHTGKIGSASSSSIPWDEVVKAVQETKPDPVETRLLEYSRNGSAGA